jgi:putative transposase
MSNYRRAFIENSMVFITMVTYKRNPILIKNIKQLIKALRQARNKYSFKIIGFVVLPDHIHALIHPKNIKEYPKIISSFKAYFSRIIDNADIKNVKEYLTKSKILKREKGVWQRRYWEHTIQNENEYNSHLDYIHYNPVKHNCAKNVKDWNYSSFHKFVKEKFYDENWGNFEDINRIEELIYE